MSLPSGVSAMKINKWVEGGLENEVYITHNDQGKPDGYTWAETWGQHHDIQGTEF